MEIFILHLYINLLVPIFFDRNEEILLLKYLFTKKRIYLIEIETNIFKASMYYYKHLFHYSTQLFDYNLFHNKYKYLKIEKYRATLIVRTYVLNLYLEQAKLDCRLHKTRNWLRYRYRSSKNGTIKNFIIILVSYFSSVVTRAVCCK